MIIKQDDKRMTLPTFEPYHTAVRRFAADHKMKIHEAVAHIVVGFLEAQDQHHYLDDIPRP